jgi:hypothetical protein
MSYILDALKKIEHEKNKKRPDGRVSIANDLFQERKQPHAGTGVGKIAALVVAAALITGGGTWFVLKGSSTKNAIAVRPSTPPKAPPIMVPVTPPPAPTSVQTVVQTVVPAAAPPTVQPPAAAAPVTNAAAGEDAPASRRAKRATAPAKARPVAKAQPVQTVAAPADIKLSGIAWQDEHSGRRAVINGFLLKEGAIVSGARIIDIQADRVRFASSGGEFEIRLDAVLPAEVKR